MPHPPLLLGLLADTPVHAGAGRSLDVIDLPVQRERTTDHPIIAGSGMKGAMREQARSVLMLQGTAQSLQQADQNDEITQVFGAAGDGAEGGRGGVLVGEARTVLLPVRSLQGLYFWVTCPYLLERLERDAGRAGLKTPKVPANPKATGFLAAEIQPEKSLDLEERRFERDGELEAAWPRFLGRLIAYGPTRDRLPAQLVVVHDDAFAWFGRHALPVASHNVLDPDTKASLNLWTEESLAPDTLMCCLVAEAAQDQLAGLRRLLRLDDDIPRLRVGGNQTTGMGWFAVARVSDAGEQGAQR